MVGAVLLLGVSLALFAGVVALIVWSPLNESATVAYHAGPGEAWPAAHPEQPTRDDDARPASCAVHLQGGGCVVETLGGVVP